MELKKFPLSRDRVQEYGLVAGNVHRDRIERFEIWFNAREPATGYLQTNAVSISAIFYPHTGGTPLTKQYLVKRGETCAADIYYALSREIERMNKERIETGEKPFRRPNYSSFAKYFHWFKLLGLIERTDRKEPAIYDFLEKRVFYRLTDKGQAEVRAWEDPVRAAHPEFV